MRSQNSPEDELHPAQASNRFLRAIQTIYQLKLWRILLTLLLLAIIFYAISIWLKGNIPSQLAWLGFIPWESLATTSLGVAIIGFVYEWVVRNETKQELDEVLGQHFRDQARAINAQLPRAMLTTPDIMRQVLSSDVVDEVILTSLEIRLRDAQLAKEAYDSFLRHLLVDEERRSNYRCKISLTPTKSGVISQDITQKYYDAYIDVRYETHLQKNDFRFICVPTADEYSELLRDPNWELRWIAEPIKDFPGELNFDVETVQVAGLKLDVRREASNGKYVVVADHLKLQSMQGNLVNIYYRYKVRIKKRGHLLMVHMPCPTYNVVVELDYANTDIHFVNVLDFFVSKTKPAIRYFPSPQKHHRIEVEVDDWVFPRGGIVFVWVLRAERNPDFWKLSTPDVRRSKRPRSNSRITNTLPPVLPVHNADTQTG